ncbi:MAG: alkaline phosphatase D family protein [Nannocystaceae bacterium]
MQRRSFLRAILCTAAAPLTGAACRAPEAYTPVEDGAAHFTLGVASGDPRPESVILWTRVEDDDADADADLELLLEVARDPDFVDVLTIDGAEALSITAEAMFDRCVKVKVRGLDPAVSYYYRFLYSKDGRRFGSRVGVTKTAPAKDDDVTVRFAFVSCQDFVGRYYNAYRHLLGQELDFVVHLGDYIYETTGDPSFQELGSRGVSFDDTAGAIAFNEGTPDAYYAARSLDNYRQLYRTIRSDKSLQEVHATLAMLVIWDDHEFSNDCWGATSTYFDGRADEADVARRKAANQAWFEYMPVDLGGDDLRYDPSADFPGDLEIYRDFAFGKHLHLVLTDLRSHRADHLVPEDAFPGAVVVDQAQLTAMLGEVPSWADPYVDVDTFLGGIYGDALRAAAPALGYDAAKVAGKQSALFLNSMVDAVNGAGGSLVPIDDETLQTLERGVAFATIGKSGFYSSFGSRYLVAREPFAAYSELRWQESAGASEDAMGPEQEAWFLQTMQGSDRTWKVWANEFTLMPLQIDLTFFPTLPAAFIKLFALVADSWDGQPKRRDLLLDALSKLDNVVAITGDIHSFFAGLPSVRADADARIIELVTSSITSQPLQRELESLVANDPVLSTLEGAGALASGIKDLLTTLGTNPHMAHADVVVNGYATVELDGSTLRSTFYAIADGESKTDHGDDVDGLFVATTFQVNAGERELYQDFAGALKRWDTATKTWV